MEIEILSVMVFPSVDADRRGQSDTLIVMRIDGQRTDSLTIPKEVTDKAELEKIITAEMKKRSALIGHKFTST